MRNVGERLDVIDHSRIEFIGTGHEEALHVRRKIRLSRHGRVPFYHLQQRLFLAEQVVLGTKNQLDGNHPQQSGGGLLVMRAPHRRDLRLETLLQAEVRRADADCITGDRHSLQQLVRIVSEKEPILERSWLALGTVADQVLCRTGILRHGLPFRAGWKAGTASTAKERPLDFGDNLSWRHSERLP